MELLADRGITLSAFGAAYLLLLVNLLAGACCFHLARSYLVITPNRASSHYGLYAAAVLLSLGLATILENELLPGRAGLLSYAALPHVAMLLLVHWFIHRRQEPWLVALGIASIGGALAAAAAAAPTGHVRPAHWMSLLALSLLVGWLWLKSVSTKRAFITAKSIYLASKEDGETPAAAAVPWLGLRQWMALFAASVALATLNALVRGSDLSEIPALAVLGDSLLMLGATAAVSAVPAASYWWAHRAWMPELGRFVWLAWLVVGFALSYGTYLKSFA